MTEVKRARRFDEDSSADISIVTEHAHIHRGKGFVCAFPGSLGSGETFDTLITVPLSVFPHLRLYEYDVSGAPCDLLLYEAPTVANTGTDCPVLNLNRTKTNSSGVLFSLGSSLSAIGIQLEYHLISGGKQEGGSHENATTEWNLNHNTIYAMRLINRSGGAISFGGYGFFYI